MVDAVTDLNNRIMYNLKNDADSRFISSDPTYPFP